MSSMQDPAAGGFAITPNDTANLLRETRGIYCGGDGDLHVLMADGLSEVTFKNLTSGGTHGYRLKKVFATGTTATDILGLL